jgi:hypothetical protein
MRTPAFAICLAAIVSLASLSDVRAASPYVIEGLHLGSLFTPGRGYQCKASEQFADCTFCRRNENDRGRHWRASSVTKVLHDRNGTLGYASREVRPASFSGSDIANEIKRLSTRFGPVAREIRLPDRDGFRNIRIAIWGELELEQIAPGELRELQARGAQTVLIDHLGNVERSKRLGFPIYRLKGGPGFVWSAAADEDGPGHLRFLFFDAAVLTHTKAAAKELPPPQPASGESSVETSLLLNSGSSNEPGSSKQQGKSTKVEDRLPQASNQDAARSAEQKRIVAAERLAAEERVRARLAWERHQADRASDEARDRLTGMVIVLSLLLLSMLALMHRFQAAARLLPPLERLRVLGSFSKAQACLRSAFEKIQQVDKVIVRGRALLAFSQSEAASQPRS